MDNIKYKKIKIKLKKSFKDYWQIYLLLIPVIVWYLVFCYFPMYGIVLAFKDYLPKDGIVGSAWLGLEHFKWLFEAEGFTRALKNTIVISLLKLIFCFPAPIILSIFLNEIISKHLKKVIQTAIYLPFFISWVVMAGIIYNILSVNGGLINNILTALGFGRKSFMTDPNYFYLILIIAEIWKGTGWGTVIYIAAISGISPDLYESAEMDGCGRIKKMIYITIPCIFPVIILMLILQIGNILNAGFDPIFNLYNVSVYSVADILDTYAYTLGIGQGLVEKGTALGIFKAVINFVILLMANATIKKMTGQGLYD